MSHVKEIAVFSVYVLSEAGLGSISAALSCPVYVPHRKESSGEERGLLSRTAAGNRAKAVSVVKFSF